MPGAVDNSRGSGPLLGGGAQPRIAMNSLVNEDSLPEWLRNAANSGALPPMSSAPTQNPAVLAGNGWEPIAQSLNPSSLPSQDMPGGRATGQLPYGQPPMQQRPLASHSPVSTGSLEANKLFDESALPEWLRAGAMGQSMDQPTGSFAAQNGYGNPNGYSAPANQVGYGTPAPSPQSGPLPPASSAFPGIDRAGSFSPSVPPQNGMSGPSLIDANALPQWLSGQLNAPAMPGNGRDTSHGMSAGSLVDDKALPQWLRNESATPPNYHGTPAGGWNNTPSVGAEALPSWLSQESNERMARREPPSTSPSAWTGYATGMPIGTPTDRTVPPPHGLVPGTISGNEFVDESVLPEWLRSQGAVPGAKGATAAVSPASFNPFSGSLLGTPENGMGSGDPRRGQPNAFGSTANTAAGFSASDLIDPSSLPDWVQGADATPSATFSSAAGWTSRQPAPQVSQTPGIPSAPSSPGNRNYAPSYADDDSDEEQMDTWRARVPEPLSNGPRDQRHPGNDNSSIIPRNELPAWLMNNVPEPFAQPYPPQPPQTPQPSRRPRQQSPQRRNGNARRQNEASMYSGGWDDHDPYANGNTAAQQNQYADAAYTNYDENEGYRNGKRANGRRSPQNSDANQQENQQKPRSGWRRFFGRK